MFIAILWSIAILCIVVHCVNCITIVWTSGATKWTLYINCKYQELLYIIYEHVEHVEHTPTKVSITQNVRPSVNELRVSLVFYLKLRCLNINIYIYIHTVTRDLALCTGVAKYDASYSSPWNEA